MSQDVVADGLNQIMNARRVEKKELVIRRYSKVLLSLFEMMKKAGHIDFEVNEEDRSVKVMILKINECRAVKPRYYASVSEIEKKISKNTLVVSIMKQNLGGSVVVYFY